MTNFLHKVCFWGGLCALLKGGYAVAQPIQLIPQKSQTPQIEEDITASALPSLQEEEESEFWEGTPPSVIETYFSKIPLHLTSPALRTLRTAVLKEKYPFHLHLKYVLI